MLLAIGHRRSFPVLAAFCFAAGISAGALIAPAGSGAITPPADVPRFGGLRSGHPAEVLRVIDGDTFEARVAIWPGMQVTTRVRLRGVDAPEMRAHCPGELTKAHAAREALTQLLTQGAVGVFNIGQDKYGGRVDADVSTALLDRGVVRRFAGGRREGWCD